MKPLHTTAALLTICYLLFTTTATAQPGVLDLTFNPGTGANNDIHTIAIQPDGKILIGGEFTTYNGDTVGRIARLQPNGTLDTTFNPGTGFTNDVYDLQLYPDGRILVAGLFGYLNGDSCRRLARLHADGTRDTTLAGGLGFNAQVNSIALQPDGKIIAGGEFTQYMSMPVNYLVRLNQDGSIDTSFHSTPGPNGTIGQVTLQPDGKIMIGGDFTSYNNDFLMRFARLLPNGNRDSTLTALPGASAFVNDIEMQPNGRYLIGGHHVQFDFVSSPKIARTNTNGTRDSDFNVGTSGANDDVHDIELVNNRILLVGGFTTFKEDTINRIVMVDEYCTPDTTFNTGSGANYLIRCAKVYPGSKILIAGNFTNFNGTSIRRIARLYNCLTPQPDSIYGNSYALCSGTQQVYSVTPVSGAAKYEWTLPNGWSGSSDSASITAISNGVGGTISVKAFTDSCGWSYVTTRNITTIQPDVVPICLVTVDSQSTHNIVMWEKPQTALIDSFIIYRETTSNVYTKLGSLPYSALSEYHDYTANPNTTSYRYKLSVLDTCGVESDLSLYHSTIHLQHLGNGNFQWTFYNIESTLNPVLSFNVYRDPLGNGNYFPIGNVPGTNSTFTDVTANSFPDALYVVDANWSIACNPSRAVNTTRSNIKPKGIIDIPLSINADEWTTQVRVVPNPAKDKVRVIVDERSMISSMKLINNYGQLVKGEAGVSEMNLENIPAGVYMLFIETNKGRVVKKVVVER